MLLGELFALCLCFSLSEPTSLQIKCVRQEDPPDNVYESLCGSKVRLPCSLTNPVGFPSPVSCLEFLRCRGNQIQLCQCIHGSYFVTSEGYCVAGEENRDKCGCPATIPAPTTRWTTTVPPATTNSSLIPAEDEATGDEKKTRVLDIVGGTIGGLVLVIIIVGVVALCFMRKRSRNSSKNTMVENPEYTRRNSVILSEINENTDVDIQLSNIPARKPPDRPLPEIPVNGVSGNNPPGTVPHSNGGTVYQKLIQPHSVHTDVRDENSEHNGNVETNDVEAYAQSSLLDTTADRTSVGEETVPMETYRSC